MAAYIFKSTQDYINIYILPYCTDHFAYKIITFCFTKIFIFFMKAYFIITHTHLFFKIKFEELIIKQISYEHRHAHNVNFQTNSEQNNVSTMFGQVRYLSAVKRNTIHTAPLAFC